MAAESPYSDSIKKYLQSPIIPQLPDRYIQSKGRLCNISSNKESRLAQPAPRKSTSPAEVPPLILSPYGPWATRTSSLTPRSKNLTENAVKTQKQHAVVANTKTIQVTTNSRITPGRQISKPVNAPVATQKIVIIDPVKDAAEAVDVPKEVPKKNGGSAPQSLRLEVELAILNQALHKETLANVKNKRKGEPVDPKRRFEVIVQIKNLQEIIRERDNYMAFLQKRVKNLGNTVNNSAVDAAQRSDDVEIAVQEKEMEIQVKSRQHKHKILQLEREKQDLIARIFTLEGVLKTQRALSETQMRTKDAHILKLKEQCDTYRAMYDQQASMYEEYFDKERAASAKERGRVAVILGDLNGVRGLKPLPPIVE